MIYQGRTGLLSVDSAPVRVYDWQLSSPRNLVIPQDVGSTWASNYAEGLQSTRVVINTNLRQSSAEGLELLDLAINRTFSGNQDDTAAVPMVLTSGARTFSLANCKVDSFVLTSRPGMQVGLQAVLIAPGIPTIGTPEIDDYATQADLTAPMMGDMTSVGVLADPCYGWELRYTNNHQPDAPLNGTKTLLAWNAGRQTAGLSLTVKEGGGTMNDGAALTILLKNGAGTTLKTLALTSCVVGNPRDMNVNAQSQQFRSLVYDVLGNATTPPLVIS